MSQLTIKTQSLLHLDLDFGVFGSTVDDFKETVGVGSTNTFTLNFD